MGGSLKDDDSATDSDDLNGDLPEPSSCLFSEGEKVLAYLGRRIYEAKVQKTEIRKKEWRYFVHYLGWNKNWDEWVAKERLMKYTEENILKQQATEENILKQQALDKKQGADKNQKSARAGNTRPKVSTDAKLEEEDSHNNGTKVKRRKSDVEVESVQKSSDQTVSSRVRELLECPECKNDMYPPIYQCPKGHTLCSKCKARVDLCPTCRYRLYDTRCLALERIAETLKLPCRFQNIGCVGIFPYLNKLNHENGCAFKPYNCTFSVGSDCKVTGDISNLVKHLKDDHNVSIINSNTCNHLLPNPNVNGNGTWRPTVLSCFGQYFCLHFEKYQLGIASAHIAFMRFMGEENEANKYCYSLEVGANEWKLTWRGKPCSIRDSHIKVRDSFDGLIIPHEVALFISCGDKKELNLAIRIWKIEN